MKIFLLIFGGLAIAVNARRIRVRPVGGVDALEAPQQVEYYAEQEEDEGPVLVSRQDTYGRATGQARLQPKLKPDAARAPPVQTIRNYNKLNDDGSFTFGYEAADGSFKEETRGTDCVVRGKYGYVDPDGNKREFTYVSGNPCDPDAVHQEEEEVPDSGEENVPQNLPVRRPLKPQSRPQTKLHLPSPRPTTVFQQDYSQESEEENVAVTQRPRPLHVVPQQQQIPQHVPQQHLPQQHLPQQHLPQQAPQPRPAYRHYPIPTFAQLEEEIRPQVLRPTPRPKPVLLAATPSREQQQSVTITPRPNSQQPPATTYRPQSVTPTAKPLRPSPTASSAALDFEQELKNFQLEHNVVSTPRPTPKKVAPQSNQPIYTSELVFDPSSGQYNTVVYQQLPQSQGDFSLRGRLQPYVAQAPQQYYRPRQALAGPPPPPRQQYPSQQDLFQQQQAALVQQSQQLFAAQQQRKLQQKPLPGALLQQEPQRFSQTPKPFAPSQPFYYVSPDRGLASGQIDAFLRGHSIAL